MSNCPYCQASIVEEYYFCVECERQVKCRSCDGLLLANKTRCLRCGTAIVDREAEQGQMNEYSLEENQTSDSSSRSIHVRATDNAITSLAPLLGLSPQQAKIISVAPSKKTTPLTTLPQLQEPTNEQKEQIAPEENVQNVSLQEKPIVRHKWEDFFEMDNDGSLSAKVVDYKGKTKKDQQKRFILLCIWSYQYAVTDKPVSKDNINVVAKKSGLYDANFSRYIDEVLKEYTYTSGPGFKMNPQGIAVVTDIVKDMEDGSKTGIVYWKGSLRSNFKRSTISKEDEQNIDEWVKMELDLGKLDIRSLRSSTNYAMLAVWILTKKLKVVHAVKSRLAFEFLKKKYATIPVKSKGFVNAFSVDSNAQFFQKNSDGLYYITESAEKKVVSWIDYGLVQQDIGFEDEPDDDSDDEGDE